MFPRASEESFSVYGFKALDRRQETHPAASRISISNNDARKIEHASFYAENTNCRIVTTNAAEHCVVGIEIQIRVLVQPPGSRYLFVLAYCLNLRHGHRIVS